MEFTHSAVARSSRTRFQKGVLVLLAFLSPAGSAVWAQGPVPRLGSHDAVFESSDAGLAVVADNGFEVSVVAGEWRHRGHRHLGGSGAILSPWGEEMPVRYWFNPDGSFAVEYDRNAILHYAFDARGGLTDVTAASETELATSFAGHRAEAAALGGVDPLDLDLTPYEVLFEQLSRNHGNDFLDGANQLSRELARTGVAAPASCVTDILGCTASIVGWVATVPGIAAGCTVGGVVSFGAACLAAILGHEGASIAAVATCTAAIQNCTNHDHQQGDPGDGCNGPGDGPE